MLRRYLHKHIHLITTMIFCGLLAGCTPAPPFKAYQQGNIDFQQKAYYAAYLNYAQAVTYKMPAAQYALGYLLYNGLGVKKDTVLGIQYIQSAANAGYPKAKTAIRSLKKHRIPIPSLDANNTYLNLTY